MALHETNSLRVVLYEGAGATDFGADARWAMLTALLEQGFAVTRTVAGGRVAPQARGQLLVLGQFADGAAPEVEGEGTTQVRVRDVTGCDATAVTALATAERQAAGLDGGGAWKPWFPVIDYDRCTNCMQCLSFCLFGVYGVDANHKIQAQNEDQCKTNCPACSRVCPEAAIMFPKYKAGPINGDEVQAADLGKEKMKVDISALLGGDVYSALRARSTQAKERFSRERDEKKALNERQKCLTKLAQGGDIPIEVLMSLPAPEEILRRAEVAKAKAAAALAAQPTP